MPYFWIFGFNAVNGTVPGLNLGRLPQEVLDVPHGKPRDPGSIEVMDEVGDVPHPPTEPGDDSGLIPDVGDVPHPPTEPGDGARLMRNSPGEFASLLDDIHLDVPHPPPGTLRYDPHGGAAGGTPISGKLQKIRVSVAGSLRAIAAKDQNVEDLLFLSSRVFASEEDAKAFVRSGPGERLFRHCPNCVLYELELTSASATHSGK